MRSLIASVASGEIPAMSAARALRDWRLLAPVVAVLDDVDESGADKDSHMAVVSMVNAAGAKGMLAFTGSDSLNAWDSDARPVPSRAREIARSALDDGSTALVIDVAGPVRLVIEGSALLALADQLDLAQASALVHAGLAPLTADGWVDVEVVDARGDDVGVDVVVQISAVGGGHPDGRLLDDLAHQAARVLQERPDIQRCVPGGLGVAVVS